MFQFSPYAPENIGSPISILPAVLSDSIAHVIYSPKQFYNGLDAFAFRVADVRGRVSDLGNVSVMVEEVNQLPYFAAQALSKQLAPTNTSISIVIPVFDIDETEVLTLQADKTPAHG